MRMFDSERKFADFLIANNKTYVFQPPRFKLKKTTYRTDFYCPEDDTYYEVIGNRQAYHANEKKINEFKELYPNLKFEIVKPDGRKYPSIIKYISINRGTIRRKTKLFTLHICIDLLGKAKELAKKERRSTSSIINQALNEFFERREK